jgi:MoaA/NifB/PqqE/SkfB family radical SAM enzyme
MNPDNLSYRRIHQAINYRLRTFGGGRLASFCQPTSTIIALTERCNARCIHCDIWKNRGKEDRPTCDEWERLLADLRRWLGPVDVVFSGGEALLNRDAIDLVKYSRSIGLFVELLSHGFWENQAHIEELALARPARVTISFDGIGETHSLIRGRAGFVEKTTATIRTLQRMREQLGLKLGIRLKTVIMQQNLDDVCAVAHFAKKEGLEVFYQPIEQNYNTVEDPNWFEHSDTWPKDREKAIAVVRQLRELKAQRLPIANSFAQLDAMIPYFWAPADSRVAVQAHSAHEPKLLCGALTTLQLQANGDVTVCTYKEPVGNIRTESIRKIWQSRPRWWEGGCCLTERLR